MTADAPQSALAILAGQLALIVDPLRRAGYNPTARQRLFAALGWNLDQIEGFPTDRFSSAATAIANLVTDLVSTLQDGNVSKTTDEALLSSVGDIVGAIRALSELADDPALQLPGQARDALAALGDDMVGFLIAQYLMDFHPVMYNLARLLALARTSSDNDAHTTTAIEAASGEANLREAVPVPALNLRAIPDLLTDPAGTIRREYLAESSFQTPEDARRLAAVLVDRLGWLANATGALVGSGGDPPLPAAVDPLRAVTAQWPIGGTDGLALMLEILAANEGGPAARITPVGWVEQTWYVAGWGLELIGSISDAFTIAPQSLGLDSDNDLALGLTVSRQNPDGQPVAIVGSPNGTHFGIGAVQLGAKALYRQGRTEFVITIDLRDSSVVVAGSDGDGLLASTFPSTPLDTHFSLSLAWSSLHGLSLNSGTGLSGTVPLGRSLGPLSIDSITLSAKPATGNIDIAAGARIRVVVPVLTITVDGVGVLLSLLFPSSGGNLGPVEFAGLRFKPPAGVGLTIDAKPVSGGGYLTIDPARGRYAGGLELAISSLSLAAVGLVATKTDDGELITFPGGRPGYSLVVIIAATFPPIQIGLGFALAGVGGMLGYNRTINVDALRAGVRSKALDTVLFPANPAGNADHIVSALATDFPIALGRLVVGPMVRLTWGEPALATIDLAVLMELPDPVRITLLGRLRLGLPRDDSSAVIRINLDAVGVADFGQGSLSLDATIYDSKIGVFALSGDMALRLNWKGQRRFLLSIGGWHPAFTAPPDFPALRRITLALTGSANVQFSVAAYFAVTSNTVQFGGRADVKLSGGGAALTGMISLDTLINISPFGLRVDFAAALAISFEGANPLAIAVSGTLTGPNPWHIHATASFTILAFTAKVTVDTSFGPSRDDSPAVTPVNVLSLVSAEVAKTANWLATQTAAAGLIRVPDAPADAFRVHPLATLAFHQRTAPLGVPMTRFGPAGISGAKTISVSGATVGGSTVGTSGEVVDDFAPANFLDLTDAQKLSSPAFVTEQAGVGLDAVPVDFDELGAGDPADLNSTPDFIDPDGEPPPAELPARLRPSASGLRVTTRSNRPAIRVLPARSGWANLTDLSKWRRA